MQPSYPLATRQLLRNKLANYSWITYGNESGFQKPLFRIEDHSSLSRAETVTVAASHMSPYSRLQSQRRTPLQRPRHLESAPKPQVVDNSARDPGKEHAPQVRMAERPPCDPEKRHVTRAHSSTPEIACDRGKKYVTQARDLSRDQTGPQQSRDPTRSRDQIRSRDQTRSSN